jgi:3-deoxy-7-phosphoheptulonate synthase
MMSGTWITLQPGVDVAAVRASLQALGLWTEAILGTQGGPPALAVAPHSRHVPVRDIVAVPGVQDVMTAPSAHPRVDAQAGVQVPVGRALIGGPGGAVLVAGPCSVESEEQIEAAADMVARAGAVLLRGGAFKPRVSPYSFQGVGRTALTWLRRAAERVGLGVVTEVLGEADVDEVAELADMVQVGSRNMQNFALLRAVARTGRPVMLKRGMTARVEDWLLAGEHLLAGGASHVVFCERGIVGFDPSTRNLLDLGAVALLKHVHRQPVMVDPSHAVGRRDLIPALSRAALAAGADGLVIEAHPEPGRALSDGAQALDEQVLGDVAREMKAAAAR